MTRRTAAALAVCALVLIAVPWIIGNEFYVNMASQVLIYALFALSINMMLGYGGMVSLAQMTDAASYRAFFTLFTNSRRLRACALIQIGVPSNWNASRIWFSRKRW